MKTAILWFRRDLRVHDHPALNAAMERADRLVSVFVLDDRLIHGRHASGARTQFLLECLRDLDAALQKRGTRLVVRHGSPEQRDVGCEIGSDYPQPIVDHREAREQALDRYRV